MNQHVQAQGQFGKTRVISISYSRTVWENTRHFHFLGLTDSLGKHASYSFLKLTDKVWENTRHIHFLKAQFFLLTAA